jgi:hypothetical protein
MPTPSVKFLKDTFAVVGADVVWKNPIRKAYVGRIAGNLDSKGYRRVEFLYKRRHVVMMAHRIAWCIHNSRHIENDEMIDHIDGNKANNSPSNLRAVSAVQNGRNKIQALSHSDSKLLGVVWNARTRKWRAAMRVHGKLHHLGYFEDVVDAVRAYWNFRRETEPGMWHVWKATAKRERLQARKMFKRGCGPDGKAAKSLQRPVVHARLLSLLLEKNARRLNRSEKTESFLKMLTLRFVMYKGMLIWRSAEGKGACVGSVAGNKRSDGRVIVEIMWRGKRVSMNTSVIAWMLQTQTEIPKSTRIKHLDGDRANVALSNMQLSSR